jgi:protein-S-isoprenylcysteine O-methyltransferase Ste14
MKKNILTLIIGLTWILFLIMRYGSHEWNATQGAGVAIGLPSLALPVLARMELGSARAKAQTLVTPGLYARIRNPIYVYGGLGAEGLFLYVNRPVVDLPL